MNKRVRRVVKNKRGSEMAIGTLVVIVLAVLVLIVLVLGFTTGWKALWDKITPYIGGGSGGASNVDSVRQACDILCRSASVSPSSGIEYCKNSQTVVYGGGKPNDKKTCRELEGTSVGVSACDVSCQ